MQRGRQTAQRALTNQRAGKKIFFSRENYSKIQRPLEGKQENKILISILRPMARRKGTGEHNGHREG